MKRLIVAFAVLVFLASASAGRADTFGTGDNVFDIDFLPISGSTNPTVEQANEGDLYGFGIVEHDYRMGMYEITNGQWDKFKTQLGVAVTGFPWPAYDEDSYRIGTNIPTGNVSWYEAAQFANWLNTSTGHQAAYNFTGTQGTSDYTFATWSAAEAAGGMNLYRHKDAVYYLPTEDEWVKAAYWNGTRLQDYATKAGESLTQGNGTSGTGWNYFDDGWATDPRGPWNVGSGSEELNGTYDMMGNYGEWTESPLPSPTYGVGSPRGRRSGDWHNSSGFFHASELRPTYPTEERNSWGFRVASIPEPSTIALLAVGAVALLAYAWRRKKTI